MDKYTALAKVVFYYDTNCSKTECIAISNVVSFTDAMEKVEEYYGDDLETCEITLIADWFWNISEDEYNKYKYGGK